jgi:hypothetical protein
MLVTPSHRARDLGRRGRFAVWPYVAVAAAWCFVSVAATASAQELARGESRVSGRVIAADTGAPLAGARVALQGVNLPPSLAYVTTSDASGAFDFPDIYGPREYRLTATKAGFYSRTRVGVQAGQVLAVGARQALEGATVSLLRAGAVSGRIVDEFGEPLDHVQVHALRLRYGTDGTRTTSTVGISDITDDLGQFRIYALPPADYLVVAAGRNARVLGPNLFSATEPAETAPTYYPGTSDLAEAQTLSIGAGQQATAIMTLIGARTVTISGTAMRSSGTPAAGMRVILHQALGAALSLRSGGTVSANGEFEIEGVAPGSYTVSVYQAPRVEGPVSGRLPVLTFGEWASIQIVVGGNDVSNLSMVTRPGATVTGNVVFERPRRADAVVQLRASTASAITGMFSAPVSDIGPDGRFELSGVPDDAYLSLSNGAWTIKSIAVDGRDLGDDPLEFNGSTRLSDVVVTVTDRLTDVSGTVSSRGQPLAEQLVVLHRVGTSLPLSRNVRTIRTDERGRFQVRGLGPGSYVAAAVEEGEGGFDFSPDFQERLRTRGRGFSLAEGETVSLDLAPGLP